MMIEKSPEGIRKILEILISEGYEAYLVGGCVRDRLLGFEPKDYDVTTNAKPHDVVKCFRDYRVIETGIKHGTVTVICEGEPCEITTFRTDGVYTDNRHPDNVTFSDDLASDLSRRDFTVNSMAWGQNGLVDLFGGEADLKNGVIRAVGESEKRFSEDALRIMRALRFSSRLGFEIEKETAVGMRKCAHLLENIARERIFSELVGIVMGKSAFSVTRDFADILSFAVGKTTPVSDELALDSDVRLAALFSKNADAIKSLKTSRTTENTVEYLIENADSLLPEDIPSAQRFIRRHGYELALKLCLLRADKEAYTKVTDVKRAHLPSRICDLAVRGNDIILEGYSGAQVSRAFEIALDGVISGECRNRKKDILEYIDSKKDGI